MADGTVEWSEDRLNEYHRGWKKGPREAWYPPVEAVESDDRVKTLVDSLMGVALPVDVLELDVERATPWPRSWTWRVHRRVLMYHPAYSHTKGARKYYDFNDEELFCSMCVKLDIDFQDAMEMDPWELLRVVYDRVRRLRVPEQTEEGPLVQPE